MTLTCGIPSASVELDARVVAFANEARIARRGVARRPRARAMASSPPLRLVDDVDTRPARRATCARRAACMTKGCRGQESRAFARRARSRAGPRRDAECRLDGLESKLTSLSDVTLALGASVLSARAGIRASSNDDRFRGNMGASSRVLSPRNDDDDDARRTRSTPSKPVPARAVDARVDQGAENDGEDGLTAFERERERTIARNKARMEALNISTLSADVGGKSGAAPSSRGIAAKRKRERAAPKEPTRRSSRTRNIAPELASGVDRERRDGSVVLADGATYLPTGERTEAPVKTRPSGEVALKSENGSEKTDAAFIETLKRKMGAFVETKARDASAE